MSETMLIPGSTDKLSAVDVGITGEGKYTKAEFFDPVYLGVIKHEPPADWEVQCLFPLKPGWRRFLRITGNPDWIDATNGRRYPNERAFLDEMYEAHGAAGELERQEQAKFDAVRTGDAASADAYRLANGGELGWGKVWPAPAPAIGPNSPTAKKLERTEQAKKADDLA